MAESKSADAEQWRRKYYDSLGDLEQKERAWQQVEETLRQTILRLSLAVEPGDTRLDRDLAELRTVLKKGADIQALRQLLDAISDGITRLEEGRRSGQATPAGVVAAILEAISVPSMLAPRRDALRQRLTLPGADLPSLVESVASFLEESLSHHEDGAIVQVLTPVLTGVVQAKAPREAELLLGRLSEAVNVVARERLGNDLATVINDLINAHACDVREALLRLLEYIAVPPDLAAKVETLKSRLAAELEPKQLEMVLREIAALVAEMRSRVLEEKRGLEEFLRQLTENLKELDQNLHAAAMNQLESFSEGRKLGLAMDAQMEDLAASVATAGELDTLKTAIQQRIETIRTHMEVFRKAEEQRSSRAEQDVKALTERLTELEAETVSLRERIRMERSQAIIDPLTGVYNRLAYDERLEQEFQRWNRYGSSLVLMVWDVDRFKRINDTYGHQAGDKVLKVVAKLLASQIRTTDFICRYGGEEFVILMPETNLASASVAAEKLRASVQAADFRYRGQIVKITVSCGMAEFSPGDTPDDVFARADQALYLAKEQGRNCCRS